MLANLMLASSLSWLLSGINYKPGDPQHQPDVFVQLCLKKSRFYDQWYLNPKSGEHNLNVYNVWKKGITGKGVVVGVVDTGIYRRSELTFEENLGFKPNNSKDISLSHGTKCAGVISAHLCGHRNSPVGVAFGSKVADLQSIPSQFSKSVSLDPLDNKLYSADLRPLGVDFWINGIDIFSLSFTNIHTGFTTYPLPTDIRTRLENGAAKGRNSKGAIYVWATGNSGGNGFGRDSCAYDGYVNNPYVIPVAGVSHDLQPISSGEACSAMMVAAFTRDPAKDKERKYGIRTLDGKTGTSTIFGQNSAAVPLVAGVIALVLEANNQLTYRDVMHLLVRTSRSYGYFSNDVFDGYFMKNAAGHNVSSTFGFGVIDAEALVNASRNWRGIPRLQTDTVQYSGNQTSLDMALKNYSMDVSTYVKSIEHVEVKLNYTARNAGQIKWYLTSPGNTTSEILPGRNLDVKRKFYMHIVSNQFWDESPNGLWTLTADIKDNFHYGTVNDWSMIFYGYNKDNK